MMTVVSSVDRDWLADLFFEKTPHRRAKILAGVRRRLHQLDAVRFRAVAGGKAGDPARNGHDKRRVCQRWRVVRLTEATGLSRYV